MLMCVNWQNHFEKHIWILTSLSGNCYVSPLLKMVPPAKWQSCPSTKRFSWTEERDPIQPVEIISHLVETRCMMLKYTGLGYFAQTKSLALRLVISEKKWKSSLQLNIANVSRAFLSFRRQRSQLVVLLCTRKIKYNVTNYSKWYSKDKLGFQGSQARKVFIPKS